MAEEKYQVNTEMEKELVDFLDLLANEDGGSNRSAVIRKLIRQERDRRAQMSLPFPVDVVKASKPVKRQAQAQAA